VIIYDDLAFTGLAVSGYLLSIKPVLWDFCKCEIISPIIFICSLVLFEILFIHPSQLQDTFATPESIAAFATAVEGKGYEPGSEVLVLIIFPNKISIL
jgi:hypothetical protein